MNDIRKWYDDNAASFTEAQVVELPFIGISPEAQERLNRFKLWAVDTGKYVSLAGRKVLEFGGGHGRLPLTYPEIASYTGVDYSEGMVKLGNERLVAAGANGRARMIHSDVLSYQDSDSNYDVVCSLGMMCYCNDAAAVVRKMVSYAKPGGAIFFDFRVKSWIYGSIRRIKWAISPPTGGVTYLLKPREVSRILQNAGLTDIQLVSREFPLLAGLYAKGHSWPIRLRNRIALLPLMRSFATESWVFAKKPG